MEWLQTGFGLVIVFIEHLQNVTTNNYDSLTEIHTPKITVTTAHIKSCRSLAAVAWYRIPTADFPLLRVLELSTASATNFSIFITATLKWLNEIQSQSQSQSYLTTDGQSASLSWYPAAIWGPRPGFYYCQRIENLLTRGRVCHLQLLLVLVSAVILGSEYRGTHYYILMAQILDLPSLEGQVSVFISPRNPLQSVSLPDRTYTHKLRYGQIEIKIK
jgi:hypothetical protein